MTTADAPGPLHGIRVVDLTSIVLGPVATQILGDYGADVVKVESPEGDLMRSNGVSRHPGMSSVFLGVNRNKRSIAIDLKAADGRQAFLDLAARADVVVHNVRLKAMARLGLGYDEVRARNPRVVWCVASGFGQEGPYAARPAFDDIVQAASGLARLMQDEVGRPTYVPALLADKTAGMAVANAVLAALLHRERTGEGQAIEVPMFETMVEFNLMEHLGGLAFDPPLGGAGYGRVTKGGRRPMPCADGHVAILPYTPAHWLRLLEAIGLGDVAARHALHDRGALNRAVRELYAELERATPSRTVAEWLRLCEELDIPAAPISALDDLPAHPHLAAVGLFESLEHPSEGTIRYVRPAARFEKTPASVRQPPPRLGEHTREVLEEIGYSKEAVESLIERGVCR